MDNLTHSLVALTVSRAGLERVGRGATAALLVASNIPDIEIVSAFTSGRLAYLEVHRGPTHGLLGLALLALVTAVVVRWWPIGWRRRRERASFQALAFVSGIGVVGHVLLDLATSYGTRVMSPWSDVWFGVDWMPIVDVYLLAALALGLALSRLRPAARRRFAAAGLLVLTSDVAFRASMHEVAIRRALADGLATTDGAASSALAVRPPLVVSYLWPSRPPAVPAAMPSLVSPFRWRVVREVNGGYELSDLDLLDGRGLTHRSWHPRAGGPWVERASAAPTARVFVAFMRFPSVYVNHRPNGDVVVRWNDVRFAVPGVATPADGSRPSSPFGANVRLDRSGRVLRHGLGPG